MSYKALHRPWQSKAIKEHDSFYNSTYWLKIRAHKLERDPACEYCPPTGRIRAATTVDHVLPRRWYPELSDVDSNLRSCCTLCHNRKRKVESMLVDRFHARAMMIKEGYLIAA